jgi:hypothetical protein
MGIVEIGGLVSILISVIGNIFQLFGKKKVVAQLTTANDVAAIATAAVDQVIQSIAAAKAKEVAAEVKVARAADPVAGAFIAERVTALGANVLK